MKTRTVPAMTLALLLLTPWMAVEAQYVVKRNSCADANVSFPLEVYRNRTSLAKEVTVQVVRDGCRPRDYVEGGFLARSISRSHGGSLRDFARLKNRTSALTMPVGPEGELQVYFFAPRSPRVSGTFDYILTVQ